MKKTFTQMFVASSVFMMLSCGNGTSSNELGYDSIALAEEIEDYEEYNDEETDYSSNNLSFNVGSSFTIDGTTVYVEENRQKYICLRSSSKLSNNQMMAIYEKAPKEYVYFFDHICSEYRTGEDDYAAVQDVFGTLCVMRFDYDETIKIEELRAQGYNSYVPNFN